MSRYDSPADVPGYRSVRPDRFREPQQYSVQPTYAEGDVRLVDQGGVFPSEGGDLEHELPTFANRGYAQLKGR